MNFRRASLAAVTVALAMTAPAAAQQPSRPVVVGKAGDDLDACLSDGEVTGLNPRGDNFLAVRSAPSTNAPILGRLGPRHPVHVCDGTADDQWVGIVYMPDPAGDADCRVGSPVPRPQPYRGPCRSGWVAARYILVVAG
jgi:hypothetical protein